MESAPSTSGGRAARRESLLAPFNVVITGGTKGAQPLTSGPPVRAKAHMFVDMTEQECAGVGRALAQEFLRCGDSVIICSRDSKSLQACLAHQ